MNEPVIVNLRFLARELGFPLEKIQPVVELLDEGHPVPFIARYRKDRTGNLDEEEIRTIQTELQSQRTLAERKQTILRSIESLGKLTPELDQKIREAKTTKRLEDLYLPYKPKKQTLASIAKSKGLEPLALEILEQTLSPENLDQRASEFINDHKGVLSAADALLGAGHILSEWFSEKVELRHRIREIIQRTGVLVSKKIESKKAEGTAEDSDRESSENVPTEKKKKERAPRKKKNQEPRENPTEIPTELTTEIPTELTTEIPTELPTENTAVASSESASSESTSSESTSSESTGSAIITQMDSSTDSSTEKGPDSLSDSQPSDSLQQESESRPQSPPESDNDHCGAGGGSTLDKSAEEAAISEPTAPVSTVSESSAPVSTASESTVADSTVADSTVANTTDANTTVSDSTISEPTAPSDSLSHSNDSADSESSESLSETATSSSPDSDAEEVSRQFQDWKDQQKEKDQPVVESQNKLKKKKQAAKKKEKSLFQQKQKEHFERIFHDYFNFNSEIRKMPSHRVLALNRGEKAKILRVKLETDDAAISGTAEEICVPKEHAHSEYLRGCMQAALDRLVLPTMEREIRADLTEAAEMQAVRVFAKNLRNLLLQRPLHRKRVLALDPGFKHGCKMVVLDEFGNPLAHETVYLVGSAEKKQHAEDRIVALIRQFSVPIIAIGNGTACRETEEFIASIITRYFTRTESGSDSAKTPEKTIQEKMIQESTAPASADSDAVKSETTTSESTSSDVEQSETASSEPGLSEIANTDHASSESANAINASSENAAPENAVSETASTKNAGSESVSESVSDVSYVIVNEAGASVYSASPIAKEEFPDYDILLRGAISIGRRLQDPLNELVKVEPVSLGVGMYQHDLKAKHLQDVLRDVVQSCVNYVGVDLNSATPAILRYVSGLNQLTARRIYDYRLEHGPFKTREELKKVPGLGEVAFTHCAGFLKIADGPNPLDATWIHPEMYEKATLLLEKLGYKLDDLRDPDKVKAIASGVKKADATILSESLGIGPHTIQDILDQLAKPGRDPREDVPPPIFKKGVLKMEDLSPGMELSGTVLNVVDFGAFVDVGLHDSGLIHISQLADRYVKDAHEHVAVGDIVRTWVVDADPSRGRISLTLIPPGTAHKDHRDEQHRGEQHRGDRGPRREHPRSDRPYPPRGERKEGDGKSDRPQSQRAHTQDSQGPQSRSSSDSSGRFSNRTDRPQQQRDRGSDRGRDQENRKKEFGGSREGGGREGGGREGGSREKDRGSWNRDRDKSRGGNRYESRPKTFVSAPVEKVLAPISENMKKGKEPLRSFGDLAQLLGRVQVADPEEEKRRKKEEKKAKRTTEKKQHEPSAESVPAESVPAEEARPDSEAATA